MKKDILNRTHDSLCSTRFINFFNTSKKIYSSRQTVFIQQQRLSGTDYRFKHNTSNAFQASPVCCRGEWELKADLWLSPSHRPPEKTVKTEGERDVRINKSYSLFEDVRQLRLSCVPTEAGAHVDNTSDVTIDQRNNLRII